MAKKQTRRSISVSRTTYERLKAFCETNNISMSQLVETRVNDFLGGDAPAPAPSGIGSSTGAGMMMSSPAPRPIAPRPMMQSAPVRPIEHRPIEHRPAHVAPTAPVAPIAAPVATPTAPSVAPATSPVAPVAAQPGAAVPMSSAAVRFAVDPPPPIIKPRQDTAAPKPAEKRPEQIFTF